jgi:hypothetical protein
MKLNDLIALDDDGLRWWVLLRVRGQEMDPPPASRRETPAEYVIKMYNEAHDIPFARRLEKAVLDSIREAGKAPDLFWGPDVDALEHLAQIVVHMRLREAYPTLLEVANRGTLGGHKHVIDPRTERAIREALNAVRPHDRKPLITTHDAATSAALDA